MSQTLPNGIARKVRRALDSRYIRNVDECVHPGCCKRPDTHRLLCREHFDWCQQRASDPYDLHELDRLRMGGYDAT